MMRISLIVAMARDRAIGRANQLLWHLSSDLKRFKALTMGHPIIMGRHTYESLPNGALPGRRNIVISRTLRELPDAEVYPSLEVALSALRLAANPLCYIIGGGQIYAEALPWATDLHLTVVEAEYPDADTFFPELDLEQWTELSREETSPDERNPIASTYYHYISK